MTLPVSLRARLLAGMVVLVAAGLTVAALVTYEEQRSFLYDRVDQQVESALVPLSFALRVNGLDRSGSRASAGIRASAGGRGAPPGRGRPGVPGPGLDLPPGTFGELISPSGTVVRRRTFSYGQSHAAAARLPAHYPLTRVGSPLKPFTVPARSDSVAYRAAAFDAGGDTAVVAIPLREVQATLHRLVMVELVVGAAVIAALVALGWLVIRLGLAPLRRIERTAAEIASGDLTRRVSPDDGRTEVGRLGRALNEMLGQIEGAFADRARSEARLRRFLADASHELRTPLAAVRGYAELFRIGATSEPETLARALLRIEAEAARMGVLIEDLLLLAQLDDAPAPRRVEVEVELIALAQSAVVDARVSAGTHPITLSRPADGRSLTVRGDPARLAQLLGNLLHNAVIHTPEATAIELSLRRRDGAAIVTVRDHGPGLPPGDPRRLFERFWRGEVGRRRGPGGAGLGLAIVRAVTEAHGGTVTAAPAPDGGAVFVVALPLSAVGDRGGPSTDAHSQGSLSLLTPDS